MNRRNFVKSVASLPLASQIPSLPIEGSDDEDGVTGMSAVWIRKENTGVVIDGEEEQEIEDYADWHRETVSVADQYETEYIRMVFDFDLISMQTDNTRWRSHWAHEGGLEITIKRDTDTVSQKYFKEEYVTPI